MITDKIIISHFGYKNHNYMKYLVGITVPDLKIFYSLLILAYIKL